MATVPPVAATVPDSTGGVAGRRRAGRHAAAVVDRLAAEMQRMQATPEFRDQLLRFGMEPAAPNTPAEFAAAFAREQPRWAKADQGLRRQSRLRIHRASPAARPVAV
jgi:hypothetical protein